MNHSKKALLAKASLLILTVIITTGCGNYGNTARRYPVESLNPLPIRDATGWDGAGMAGTFDCPGEAEVVANWPDGSGAGMYRVCTDTSNKGMIRLHGKTFQETRLCVFPAEQVSYENVFWKIDLSTGGGPLMKCQDVSAANGNVFVFQYTNFNAIFVIEQSLASAFTSCLSNPDFCPEQVQRRYSYGKFR